MVFNMEKHAIYMLKQPSSPVFGIEFIRYLSRRPDDVNASGRVRVAAY